MPSIQTIEGIGPKYAQQLAVAGVKSIGAMLRIGATPAGRKQLAETSGVNESSILKWVNHCDLNRVFGVGGEYAELLEAAGVDTVPELARRNAENLQAKMTEVNANKNLVRRVPPMGSVTNWVAQAKELPRVIQY